MDELLPKPAADKASLEELPAIEANQADEPKLDTDPAEPKQTLEIIEMSQSASQEEGKN